MSIHQFIDVDFDQVDQPKGWIEQSNEALCAGVATDDYETAGEMIPRSKWEAYAARAESMLRALVREVKNQGGEGSCVGNAITGAVQTASVLQFGPSRFRPLSAISLYKRIGRSPGSGAYIPDGINEMTTRGALPLDTAENRAAFGGSVMPATGFYSRFPDAWETTAVHFAARFLRINTVDAWFSALVRGRPIVYGRQRHAIYSLLPKLSRGDWLFGYVNSWGAWGDLVNPDVGRGLGYDSLRVIDACVGYSVESVTLRDAIVSDNPALQITV